MITSLSDVLGKNKINNDEQKTWDALKLIKTKYNNSDTEYTIVRYDKNYLTNDMAKKTGLFRSVILHKDKLLCYSPPKSLSTRLFFDSYLQDSEYIAAEELVEGTMINLFWDSAKKSGADWEIATRSTVGAKCKFWKNNDDLTFRRMFLETCNDVNIDFDLLDKKYCYSFVMQHPANKIVIPIKTKKLYLIAAYELINNDSINGVRYVDFEIARKFDCFNATTIDIPKRINKSDWDDWNKIANNYSSGNTSYDILGIVFKNTLTGDRCKIRNPVYENIHRLRGNQSKLQYQYLLLRKEGKVRDYLYYFPECKSELNDFKTQVHTYTKTLYNNYVECFIKHVHKLEKYPSNFKHHMYSLHKLYLDELREKKEYVGLPVVINYFNNLHPSQQMFALNYSNRTRNLDHLQNEVREHTININKKYSDINKSNGNDTNNNTLDETSPDKENLEVKV